MDNLYVNRDLQPGVGKYQSMRPITDATQAPITLERNANRGAECWWHMNARIEPGAFTLAQLESGLRNRFTRS